MNETEVKQQFLKSISLLQTTAQQSVVRSLLVGILSARESVEALSNWFMGIVGATIALLFPAMKGLTELLGAGRLRTIFYLLAISGILGAIAKFFAIFSAMMIQIHDQIMKELTPVLQQHQQLKENIQKLAQELGLTVPMDVDWEACAKEVTELYPFPRVWRFFWKWGFRRGNMDLLSNHKLAVRAHFWQCFATSGAGADLLDTCNLCREKPC